MADCFSASGPPPLRATSSRRFSFWQSLSRKGHPPWGRLKGGVSSASWQPVRALQNTYVSCTQISYRSRLAFLGGFVSRDLPRLLCCINRQLKCQRFSSGNLVGILALVFPASQAHNYSGCYYTRAYLLHVFVFVRACACLIMGAWRCACV